MKIITFAIIILVLFIVLSACSLQKDNDRYTGIQANESVVSSIRQDIEDKENSLLANENNVFWTESGKLWHKSYDCSYLANSKTVLHGTLEEAKLEGKEKACERCFVTSVDSIYSALENKEYQMGDVFFVKDGAVWHTDINCRIILGADKIYFADEQTAKLLGKTHACAECEQ